jgi:general secretion pathway protein J
MTACAQLRERGLDPEAGFTLVELLVGIALLSFVSLALFSALRFGITAWTRGNARAEQTEQVATAQNLLRRLITDAYPLFLSADPKRKRIAFEGAPNSLGLLAPTPIALASGGQSQFVVSVSRQDRRIDLVLDAQAELAVREASPQSTRKALLRDLHSAEFSYFGRARGDKVEQWYTTWANEVGMPALVRLDIRFSEGDTRHWPEFIVAPRITADVGCVYDILTKRCQGR